MARKRQTPDETNGAATRHSVERLVRCFSGGADQLIHCAYRYHVGRMTIAAARFAESLAEAWPMIGENTRQMIASELDHEFERDDARRAELSIIGTNPKVSWLPLGMDCDREAWAKVRAVYAANTQGMPRAEQVSGSGVGGPSK